jgi:hypothetical protein
MLRRAVQLLPSSLRALSQPSLQRGFADLNLSDPAILKKFVGIEEALGVVADPRGELTDLLNQLLTDLKALPESSDYRRAVEATTQYRLKVLQQNDSNQAAEEVLDAHLEELMLETREEIALVPLMSSESPKTGRDAAVYPANLQLPSSCCCDLCIHPVGSSCRHIGSHGHLLCFKSVFDVCCAVEMVSPQLQKVESVRHQAPHCTYVLSSHTLQLMVSKSAMWGSTFHSPTHTAFTKTSPLCHCCSCRLEAMGSARGHSGGGGGGSTESGVCVWGGGAAQGS